MSLQIRRFFFLSLIVLNSGQILFSQTYSSRNNYTGDWELPGTWSTTWNTPQTNLTGTNITINGYITANGNLTFSGSASKLIINDTLVVKGDLSLGDNNDLTINDNGILIVKGALTFGNQSVIIANGYLIVTSDFTKNGSVIHGSINSNDNPVKVFICGSISPTGLTDNNPLFSAINCSTPLTNRYQNSNCSYGNLTDLTLDPIYSFFQTTCIAPGPSVTTSGPTVFCYGGSVTLTSTTASSYLWSTGATSKSIDINSSGIYTVKVKNAAGCLSVPSPAIAVKVNPLPANPTITASGSTSFCAGGNVTLTSTAGSNYLWSNGATTPAITMNSPGSFTVQVTNSDGCQSMPSTPAEVIVHQTPVAAAGPDQILNFAFNTLMEATLSDLETGEWSLISGSGKIVDLHSPTSAITGLKTGDNIFLWKVKNSFCETSKEIKITVKDQYVPSVITPNGDGKNDYFRIGEYSGKVELIIINQWGSLEYSNNNYLNDWDGRNNEGSDLPAGTYFYILKFDKGEVLRGSVLIKK